MPSVPQPWWQLYGLLSRKILGRKLLQANGWCFSLCVCVLKFICKQHRKYTYFFDGKLVILWFEIYHPGGVCWHTVSPSWRLIKHLDKHVRCLLGVHLPTSAKCGIYWAQVALAHILRLMALFLLRWHFSETKKCFQSNVSTSFKTQECVVLLQSKK